jgi:hypothetical protein
MKISNLRQATRARFDGVFRARHTEKMPAPSIKNFLLSSLRCNILIKIFKYPKYELGLTQSHR